MTTASGFTGRFTPAQTQQLLAPIKAHRVLKDGKGNSHVSHQDVVAHLSRVFGFGNWATELGSIDLINATCRNPDEPAYNRKRWDVTYRATLRLTIFDENHNVVTFFEDASCGDAQNQVLHDAHDLAMKSAISLALKRCAKNLGDQFGLSLYNKGQMTALVGGTLVLPKRPEEGEPQKDLQDDVPEQVSMGVDETEKAHPEPTEEQEALLASSLGAQRVEEHQTASQIAGEVAVQEVSHG